LGQFYLDPSLPAGGVPGEDVENHGSSIKDPAIESPGQVAFLRRSDPAIEDHHIDIRGRYLLPQLGQLAAPQQGGRIEPRAALHDHVDGVCSGSVD
jgi:hypothetical protein